MPGRLQLEQRGPIVLDHVCEHGQVHMYGLMGALCFPALGLLLARAQV